MSAVDLFAASLGAFILLVMLLFPYYRHSGSGDAWSKTESLMEQRRLAAGRIERLLAENDASLSELETLDAVNEGLERDVSRLQTELNDIARQLAAQPVPVRAPEPEAVPAPEPTAIRAGVPFSLLGLATSARSFVIVVDMSGSMSAYADLMVTSVAEVLRPLGPDNRFAIIGYQGIPAPLLTPFPQRGGLLPATAENLDAAASVVRGLARRFEGSTPTHYALLEALRLEPDAIILMSDGAPDSPPGLIVNDVSELNRYGRTEIHTVAIGDYTQNRDLVMFLQVLARRNGGDFVGVSR